MVGSRRQSVPSPLAQAAVVILSSLLVVPTGLRAQSDPVRDYYRAVGDHFGMSVDEVEAVAAWGFQPSAVPVPILLARRAGVPVDVVVTLHRNGQSWAALARRYGANLTGLRVALETPPSSGPLAPLYGDSGSTPDALTDEAIEWLVNLRVLSDVLEVSPDRVLRAAGESGDFVSALSGLLTG